MRTGSRAGAATTAKALVAALMLLVLAGCSGSGGPGGAGNGPEEPPVAKPVLTPGADARDVAPRSEITARVTDGRFDTLELRDAGGGAVGGRFSPDRSAWTATEPLGFDKTYTWTGNATGADGRRVEVRGGFSTVTPAKLVRATVNPIDGAEVGVGMPVKVEFEQAPKDRAAAERALSVESTPEVEGAWAWLNPREVHWRPREYWPAGTRVTVRANLYGVAYGDNTFGRADVTSSYAIGRRQVIKAHTPNHAIEVHRAGKPVKTYPASFGEDGNLDLNTPNGTFIIMTREPVGDFSNPRYGYMNVKKKWSMRISNHGEYIHENDENAANIGRRNTSHGCVNLLGADARELFDTSLIGDPVEVTGSAGDAVKTSDVYDWLLPWSQWKTMSAVQT